MTRIMNVFVHPLYPNVLYPLTMTQYWVVDYRIEFEREHLQEQRNFESKQEAIDFARSLETEYRVFDH